MNTLLSHLPTRALALMAAFLILAPLQSMARPQRTPAAAAAEEDEPVRIVLNAEQVKKARSEIIRRRQLMRRKAEFATMSAYVNEINRPMIEGNAADYEINRSQHEKALKAAASEKQKGEEKKAAFMTAVAELYKEAALVNYTIYRSFSDPSGVVDIAEQLQKLNQIEARFTKITRREMQRSWLTPDEFAAYKSKVLSEKSSSGRSKPGGRVSQKQDTRNR